MSLCCMSQLFAPDNLLSTSHKVEMSACYLSWEGNNTEGSWHFMYNVNGKRWTLPPPPLPIMTSLQWKKSTKLLWPDRWKSTFRIAGESTTSMDTTNDTIQRNRYNACKFEGTISRLSYNFLNAMYLHKMYVNLNGKNSYMYKKAIRKTQCVAENTRTRYD